MVIQITLKHSYNNTHSSVNKAMMDDCLSIYPESSVSITCETEFVTKPSTCEVNGGIFMSKCNFEENLSRLNCSTKQEDVLDKRSYSNPKICEKCDTVFSTVDNLDNHISECCHKKIRYVGHVTDKGIYHGSIFTDEGISEVSKSNIEIGDDSFKIKSSLDQHVSVSDCGDTPKHDVPTNPSVAEHVSVLHNSNKSKTVADSSTVRALLDPRTCDICDKICSNKQELDEHVSVLHCGNNPKDNGEQLSMGDKSIDDTGDDDKLSKKEIFHCGVCDITFTNVAFFNVHYASHIKCFQCSNRFKTVKERNKHRREKHPKGRTTWPCRICDMEFEWRCKLKIHMVIHTGKDCFVCKICHKNLPSKSKLKIHTDLHRELLQCSQCNMIFKTKASKSSHERRVHISPGRFICPLSSCKKILTTRKSLSHHVGIHEGHKYPCSICTKEFSSTKYLRKHVETDHDLLYLCQCDICGRKFKTGTLLDLHVGITHTESINYTCEKCGKGFKSKYNLNLHLRVHTGEKNYKCDSCGKSFSRGDNLKSHMRMHTGVKPYICDVCYKTFSRKDNLNTHIKQH